jgi:hypothetical protein
MLGELKGLGAKISPAGHETGPVAEIEVPNARVAKTLAPHRLFYDAAHQ